MDLFTAFLVVFAILAVACAAVYQASRVSQQHHNSHMTAAEVQDASGGEGGAVEFVAFQRQYLLIYVVVMMSDWLQGPYVYALYKGTSLCVAVLCCV